MLVGLDAWVTQQIAGTDTPRGDVRFTRRTVRGVLGLSDTHGLIAAGRPANFVLWNLREAAELAYWFGHNPARTIVRQGRIVKGA